MNFKQCELVGRCSTGAGVPAGTPPRLPSPPPPSTTTRRLHHRRCHPGGLGAAPSRPVVARGRSLRLCGANVNDRRRQHLCARSGAAQWARSRSRRPSGTPSSRRLGRCDPNRKRCRSRGGAHKRNRVERDTQAGFPWRRHRPADECRSPIRAHSLATWCRWPPPPTTTESISSAASPSTAKQMEKFDNTTTSPFCAPKNGARSLGLCNLRDLVRLLAAGPSASKRAGRRSATATTTSKTPESSSSKLQVRRRQINRL
jgi:hypothetical protein